MTHKALPAHRGSEALPGRVDSNVSVVSSSPAMSPGEASPSENPVAGVATQFQVQGIRYEPHMDQLWCALCTFNRGVVSVESEDTPSSKRARVEEQDDGALPPLSELLCFVGRTAQEVLAHCATRRHLLQFEKNRLCGLQHWCPVELHGERVLLNHHCLYPEQLFGPGRMIMDETIAGGVLLGQDVCGGVKLWPRHRYTVVELVLPQEESFVRPVPLGEGGEGQETRLQETVNVFYTPASVAALESDGKDTDKQLLSRNVSLRTSGARTLPSFYRRSYGVRSQRVQASNIAQVLRDVNKFIDGEAAYRRRRTERLAREYM